MKSDTIKFRLANRAGNRTPFATLLDVWATRYQLDGRCDYRKEKGNPPKRNFSGQRCTQELGVIHRIATALTGKLRVCGKHESSLGGSAVRCSAPFNFYLKGVR